MFFGTNEVPNFLAKRIHSNGIIHVFAITHFPPKLVPVDLFKNLYTLIQISRMFVISAYLQSFFQQTSIIFLSRWFARIKFIRMSDIRNTFSLIDWFNFTMWIFLTLWLVGRNELVYYRLSVLGSIITHMNHWKGSLKVCLMPSLLYSASADVKKVTNPLHLLSFHHNPIYAMNLFSAHN
jgi:hypothetical protein